MSATCSSISGNVSAPSDGVRVPSAMVRGLSTVCSVLVRNERVASSPALGLDADDAAARRGAEAGDGAAGEQPAAAARHEQHVEARLLPVQLERRRALAGDDVRVIERRNQRQPALVLHAAAIASRDSVCGS